MNQQATTPNEVLEDALDRAAEAVAVQSQALEELAGGPGGEGAVGLDGLLDVPVTVTIEVGRTRLPLGELVRLSHGSLVELEREVHEPADVLVNGKVVARGEIVTVGERYGVRITSVER